jgi:hypothetical protein
MRIEHSVRHAFMASLVGIIAPEPFVPVRSRPIPGVPSASQRQPEPVYTRHNLDPANHTRRDGPLQYLPTDFGIDGEKLSRCHV